MSDERRRFMSNPNIAEAGRATRFAPGLKSTRDASEKGNETKAAKKKTRELARLILSSPRAAHRGQASRNHRGAGHRRGDAASGRSV